MSLSKEHHVLVTARKAAGLTQIELAQLVRCSAATIQSIELLRLKLSKSLAARIAQGIGCDLDWLLENDISKEMPPIGGPELQPIDQGDIDVLTILALSDLFERLFVVALRQPKTSARATLGFYLVQMVQDLRKKGQESDAKASNPANWEFFQRNPDLLDADLRRILNLEELVRLNQEEEQPRAGRTKSKSSRPRGRSQGRAPVSARGALFHSKQLRNSA